MTGSASTGSPARGAQYSYTFQVKNNGPWPAPSVTFEDALPAAVTFSSISTTAGNGACAQAGGAISCAIGDLAVGAQANVVITVQAPTTPQTITDAATVGLAAPDRQPTNDTASVTVQVK